MKYLITSLIIFGSINASTLHAGAGMATYLSKQAEYAEWQHNKPFFTQQSNWSREDEAEARREYDDDESEYDGNDGGGYDGRDEYYDYRDSVYQHDYGD